MRAEEHRGRGDPAFIGYLDGAITQIHATPQISMALLETSCTANHFARTMPRNKQR
jgi:hypothetical protein